MEKASNPLRKGGNHWTLKIDLAIQLHQQLNGLDLRIIRRKACAFMYVFICQVFDRVAQDFKGAPRLRADPAAFGRPLWTSFGKQCHEGIGYNPARGWQMSR
jgi:hypothetical protein